MNMLGDEERATVLVAVGVGEDLPRSEGVHSELPEHRVDEGGVADDRFILTTGDDDAEAVVFQGVHLDVCHGTNVAEAAA